jgi:hypothetical protein
MKRVLVVGVLLLLPLLCFGASDRVPLSSWEDKTIAIAAPVDINGWVTGVTYATNTTPFPYQPSVIASTGAISATIYMRNYTGIIVRAKYARGATLTTDPVIAIWGGRTGGYSVLKSSDTMGGSARTYTLSDTAATDVDDGVTYKWTDPTPPIPTRGAFKVRVTVITEAVESASGAVTLEITRY